MTLIYALPFIGAVGILLDVVDGFVTGSLGVGVVLLDVVGALVVLNSHNPQYVLQFSFQ